MLIFFLLCSYLPLLEHSLYEDRKCLFGFLQYLLLWEQSLEQNRHTKSIYLMNEWKTTYLNILLYILDTSKCYTVLPLCPKSSWCCSWNLPSLSTSANCVKTHLWPLLESFLIHSSPQVSRLPLSCRGTCCHLPLIIALSVPSLHGYVEPLFRSTVVI